MYNKLEDRVDKLAYEVRRGLEDIRSYVDDSLAETEPVMLASRKSDLKPLWDGLYEKMVELRVLARMYREELK